MIVLNGVKFNHYLIVSPEEHKSIYNDLSIKTKYPSINFDEKIALLYSDNNFNFLVGVCNI